MLRVLFSILCLAGAIHARSLCDLREEDGVVCDCTDTQAICKPTRPLVSLVPAESKLPYENAKRRRDARTITTLILQSFENESYLPKFPKDILEAPLYLKNVSISYADFAVLPTKSIFGSDFLRELTLSFCKIKDLKRKAISEFSNLINLDLSSNEMQVFRSGVLSALPLLEELIIAHSPIHDVEPHAFVELRSLRRLSLKDNQLTYVDNQLFTGLNRLEKVDLSLNLITSIDDKTFLDLPMLKHVDLTANRLMSVAPKTFKGMHALEYLSLNFNNLKTIPDGFLNDSKKLQNLNLGRNRLEAVTLNHLHGLQVIRPDFILDITMNPLNCSCDLFYLRELRKRRLAVMESEFDTPPEFENLQCRVLKSDVYEPRLVESEVFVGSNCQEDTAIARHIAPAAISSSANKFLQPVLLTTIVSIIFLRLV